MTLKELLIGTIVSGALCILYALIGIWLFAPRDKK